MYDDDDDWNQQEVYKAKRKKSSEKTALSWTNICVMGLCGLVLFGCAAYLHDGRDGLLVFITTTFTVLGFGGVVGAIVAAMYKKWPWLF